MKVTTKCDTVKNCGNYRNCDFCAKYRQAKIADRAQALEQQHGQLTLTVLCPEKNTQAEIQKLRAKFMRRMLIPAGIWTVETGAKCAGLHINLLTPSFAPAKWRDCETYSELLTTTARDAAAYISKRAGMPPLTQYTGKLYGNWGQIGSIMVDDYAPPILRAAAIEVILSPERVPKELPPDRPYFSFIEKEKETTKDEYREIARHHLETLYNLSSRPPGINKPH